MQILAPGAEPRRVADAVEDADLVVLAIPLHKFTTLDPALLKGKLVVDVMNYWPPVDGDRRCSRIRVWAAARSSSAGSRGDGGEDPQPHWLPRASKTNAGQMARRTGVRLGSPATIHTLLTWWRSSSSASGTTPCGSDRLSAGRLLEPGGPVFGVSLRRTQFELAVRAEAA